MRGRTSAMTPGANNTGENQRRSPMLTRESAAAYLSVSKRTLDRLVRAGELRAYRIGGHRRFRIEEIESFIASKLE